MQHTPDLIATDVMLVVGPSGSVYPAAALPGLTRRGGGRVVIINPHPTERDGLADVVVRATATNALPRLFKNTASRIAPGAREGAKHRAEHVALMQAFPLESRAFLNSTEFGSELP